MINTDAVAEQLCANMTPNVAYMALATLVQVKRLTTNPHEIPQDEHLPMLAIMNELTQSMLILIEQQGFDLEALVDLIYNHKKNTVPDSILDACMHAIPEGVSQ